MARVTVEDCVKKVPNRYELVALSARRAKDLSSGAPLTIDRDNDKDAVVALREIADGTIEVEDLREHLVHSHQQRQMMEDFVGASEQEKDAKTAKDEIDAAFKDEQAEGGEVDQKALDDAGMSFAGDDVEVDD